jgi:hypothetical protein
MEGWLGFMTTFIWQLILIGVLIYLHVSGVIARLLKLSVSPHGFDIQLQEVRQKQERLKEELDALRFLLTGFVTKFEIGHLEKLLLEGPFDYKRGENKDDRFVHELIRLWDFRLIDKRNVGTFWDIPLTGNLKDYAEITEDGRQYLALLQEVKGHVPQA